MTLTAIRFAAKAATDTGLDPNSPRTPGSSLALSTASGTPISTTSSVMAIANTASVKKTTRPKSRFSPWRG